MIWKKILFLEIIFTKNNVYLFLEISIDNKCLKNYRNLNKKMIFNFIFKYLYIEKLEDSFFATVKKKFSYVDDFSFNGDQIGAKSRMIINR